MPNPIFAYGEPLLQDAASRSGRCGRKGVVPLCLLICVSLAVLLRPVSFATAVQAPVTTADYIPQAAARLVRGIVPGLCFDERLARSQSGSQRPPRMGERFVRRICAAAARARSLRGSAVAAEGALVSTVVDGQPGSTDYRLRFKDAAGNSISPWHNIPLHTADAGVFNAVIEIPKMTKPKMEVATKEPLNPIAQDVKKGQLRDYHGPIFWNYGMLPQTWEDPGVEHPVTKCSGDNDPLDVVEIGSEALQQGSVVPVKVLGILAMIDDGELDWKVIAIRTADPLAAELADITDVEKKCPGVISGIREWFRWYKTPDGKPLNAFGYEERALDKAHALEVVEETHEAWRKLRDGSAEAGKLWLK